VLNAVMDPELPTVSVCELGIVRGLAELDDGTLEVTLTPTYSGCPATEVIENDVLAALHQAELGPARARLQRAPAWSSDWISPSGRERLRDAGIAPPAASAAWASRGDAGSMATQPLRFFPREPRPLCPRCGNTNTERLSAFGSTACKALWRCRACAEPFEYFKPI
jgi:ring-1,2-phenylacetyl-CoA epoxidase subunit PaaD